ncbi:TRAP transporter small permease [Hyphomonas sp.]|uniref:TRAP transporter small permease n=1 Tax=Hyphomonas sp. TaxID=87 RepID=UPI00391B273D
MIRILSNVTRIAADLLIKAGALGLVLMTIIIGWQVFGRYVLNSTPSWSEQAALALMIWYVSLAAAAGVRQGFHIRIVALEEALPVGARKAMQIVSHTIVGLCGAAMLVWGGELVIRTWSHAVPSLGIPRGLVYLGLPISGALMALFALEQVLEKFGLSAEAAETGEAV